MPENSFSKISPPAPPAPYFLALMANC